MSLNSWKQEFYQGRIKVAAKDPITATQHSLKKWKGLKAKNLEKHALRPFFGDIENQKTGKEFSIDNSTCALCVHTQAISISRGDCSRCPIVAATGAKCDGEGSPYGMWIKNNDPKPMIQLLKATLKHLKAKQHVQTN